MKVQCTNDHTKVYLAQHGPAKVFGKNVDRRESLDMAEALHELFQRIWTLGDASYCGGVQR